MKFTREQRARIEEILPAVIDDPDYAASEIVKLEAERDRLRRAANHFGACDFTGKSIEFRCPDCVAARAALAAQGSGPCSACGDGDVEQKYHKHVAAQGSAK